MDFMRYLHWVDYFLTQQWFIFNVQFMFFKYQMVVILFACTCPPQRTTFSLLPWNPALLKTYIVIPPPLSPQYLHWWGYLIGRSSNFPDIYLSVINLFAGVTLPCIDWQGEAVGQGMLYLPDANDPCLTCTCDKGFPVMCTSVLCSPPEECQWEEVSLFIQSWTTSGVALEFLCSWKFLWILRLCHMLLTYQQVSDTRNASSLESNLITGSKRNNATTRPTVQIWFK